LAQSPELKQIQYTVQKGDNLSNITKKFGATVENLKVWNGLSVQLLH
jgi:membrane-bound lytic murein transglycosylase D